MMMKLISGKAVAVIGLSVLCGLFAGCADMVEAVIFGEKAQGGGAAGHSSLHWALGAYVDDWGDETGKYYIKYLKDVSAVFSNDMGYKDEPTILKELVFSESEGLVFYPENSISYSSSADILFNIKFSDDGTKEFKGYLRKSAKLDSNGTGKRIVFIPYSEELVKTLSQDGIMVRFTENSLHYHCQFPFPGQFKEAYELLKSKETPPPAK